MAEPPDGASGARVVRVTEATWRTYRDVRLAALLDTPRAFANTYAATAAYPDEAWLARLRTMRVWLAFVGDRPVGSVALWHAHDQPEDETHLIGMWVSSSARGRGVADLLVATALDEAAEAGYARVHLDVAQENLPAQRLYERHGFTPDGSTWDNPLYGGIREIGYVVRVPPGLPPVNGVGDSGAMSEITVRPLGEEDWKQYRDVRLTALRESPEAFAAVLEEEEAYDEDLWRLRMTRSSRLLAERDSTSVGIVSVGRSSDDNPLTAELFGLWVSPDARGSGVATALVRAGVTLARAQGRTQLSYWVGSDNGRAVAFASGIGFRPTAERRPMRVRSEDDEDEVAMVLALGGDRGSAPVDF